MKILLIEDNENDAYFFIRKFKDQEVHWSKTKSMAIQLIEYHKDFDLVITDYLGVDVLYGDSPSFEHLKNENFLITSSAIIPQDGEHSDKFVTKEKLEDRVNEILKEE